MISAAILGATGYAGQELVRILSRHPQVELRVVTTQSHGDSDLTDVYPYFRSILQIKCQETDIDKAAGDCDVVFAALPPGVSGKLITTAVVDKARVIDLGAAFRIKDVPTYEKWYQTKHMTPDLVANAVYGLPEWHENEIRDARLLANPGCYATAAALALMPLVASNIVEPASIVVDAKSGVSGAGRALAQDIHYNECNETIKAYGVATHRHTPEIEEQLNQFQHNDIRITFTPHLVPMNRGILATAYCTLKPSAMVTDLAGIFSIYREFYGDKPFIRLYSPEQISRGMPETRWVKGSNFCDIGYAIDNRTGRIIVVSALDNLVKGAAGQAVQNMNIMFGLDQTMGLDHVPLFPA